MQVSGKQELSPQTEEDIKEAKWIDTSVLKKYLDNSYASVQDVLQLVLN